MRKVNIEGTYNIPGRGTIFVADRRNNTVDLLKLKSGESILVNNEIFKIVDIECFSNGYGNINPVIGIVVNKRL